MEDSEGSSPVRKRSSSEMDRNPSPPGSDDEGPVEDSIGSTVYSKHWVFSTLTNLIESVVIEDSDAESDEESTPVQLDEEIENQICKVWDMSTDEDVASFLEEFNAPEILLGVIAKSHSNRLTEICVGILANMACFVEPCIAVSKNGNLGEVLLLLLSDKDSPTLLETSRLLLTCLSQVEVANIWIERIRKRPSVCNSICFIMKSSTNVDLLVKVGEVVDKLFDLDEELMLNWIKLCVGHEEQQASGEPEDVRPHDFGLVSCLLEAVKQLRFDSPEGLDVYMHILQLLTTVDEGVREIMHSADRGKVAWSLLSNLIGREFCQTDDPPLLILEQKTVLSSILAVMSVMFSSQTDQEYMKAEANIPLISSLVQVLQHMEECQKEPLRSCKVKMTKTEAYQEDFHLKILKDICVEFLSNILILLSKENISEGLKHGHLSEHKCCCAIRNLLPLYCTAVLSFLKVLREADEKLADALEKQFPSLRESTGQSSDAQSTGQPSE